MKVLVEGGNLSITRMFKENGWEVVSPYAYLKEREEHFDLVCFEGGADVNPLLYGELNNGLSHCDVGTDMGSLALYNNARRLNVPMVGICRGAQFLNVMAGGRMHQHYDGHAIVGTHPIHFFQYEGEQRVKKTCQVTSTHHQVMIPGRFQEVIGWAGDDWQREVPEQVEIVWNGLDNGLSFQPHPEYVDKGHECQTLFFQLIWEYFGLKVS